MGTSVGLYFRLVKGLAITFFLMSIVAIPAMMVCYQGKRVSSSDLDPMKISLLSLANVNVDGTRNVTIMNKTYDAQAAGQLLSFSDFAASLVFLVFVFFWRARVNIVVEAIDADVVSMSDYSVRCRREPLAADCRCVAELENNWTHASMSSARPAHLRWNDQVQGNLHLPTCGMSNIVTGDGAGTALEHHRRRHR